MPDIKQFLSRRYLAVTCILCPLYGRTCDGKPEHPLDVQDIPTTEEEDVLLELRFERDCCSF